MSSHAHDSRPRAEAVRISCLGQEEREPSVKYEGILRTRYPCCTIPGTLALSSLTLIFYCANSSTSCLCIRRLEAPMHTKDPSNQRRAQEVPLLKLTWRRTHVPRIALAVYRTRLHWGLGDGEEQPGCVVCFQVIISNALQIYHLQVNISHPFIPLAMHPRDKEYLPRTVLLTGNQHDRDLAPSLWEYNRRGRH